MNFIIPSSVATGANAEALPGTTRSYNLHSSNLPTVPVRSYDSATSLDYGLLKPPYEMLNRRLRTGIKRTAKLQYFVQHHGEKAKKAMPQTNTSVSLHDVMQPIEEFTNGFDEFVKNFKTMSAEEIQCAKRLQQRTEHLFKGMEGNVHDQEYYRRQRVYRLIIDHLLRVGYFETAQKLSEHVIVDHMTNYEIFQVAKQVEESLRAKELNTCLQWIRDNRSKLNRLESTFEKEVNVQVAVEMAKEGKRADALEFIQKNFELQNAADWTGNAMTMLMMVGAGPWFPGARYNKLLGDDRWQELIEMFRLENARIFNISTLSPFSAALQLGICAHKTPYCHKDPSSRCLICRDLYSFATDLPFSHCDVSRLICPYTGEPIDEINVPMMLPNGQVYGSNALVELTSANEKVYDPTSLEKFEASDVKRVFIL